MYQVVLLLIFLMFSGLLTGNERSFKRRLSIESAGYAYDEPGFSDDDFENNNQELEVEESHSELNEFQAVYELPVNVPENTIYMGGEALYQKVNGERCCLKVRWTNGYYLSPLFHFGEHGNTRYAILCPQSAINTVVYTPGFNEFCTIVDSDSQAEYRAVRYIVIRREFPFVESKRITGLLVEVQPVIPDPPSPGKRESSLVGE